MTIGERIKKLRIEQGLSQDELATKVGYKTRSAINKIELGERDVKHSQIALFASALNTNPNYLMGWEAEPHPTKEGDFMAFGTALKKMIDQKGISAAELSRRTGIAKTTLSGMFKNDVNKIDIDLFLKICDAVDCNPQEFYGEYRKNNDEISRPELEMIKKYRTLDEHGKNLVETVLRMEAERCSERPVPVRLFRIKHSIYKASAGFGFDLEDRDEWDEIDIPNTPEARKADFAVTIYGNSMEPIYYNGDIVLIQIQDRIDIGETGVFVVNGQGFIKQYGGDRLISVNSDYDDIVLSEGDYFKCAGKVIGVVKAS